MERLRGHVVHFNDHRAYGKVRGDDRVEYFAHRDDLIDVLALRPGQRVVFTPSPSPRGPRAVDVSVVELRWPPRDAPERSR